MNIAITRIDERLIHGQVAYSWSVEYQVDEIVVVDDEIVHDDMQKMLLEMAVPKGNSLQILSVEQAADYLKGSEHKKVFLVVKTPQIILDLVKKGVHFDSINIGGMYYKEGKEQITKTVYVDNNEKQIFKELASEGILLDVRTAPGDKSIDLTTKI
ncbi:MAG: PTS sugar transporter subunit IIB [Tetragenococcus koreensis]|uniref:PTS system mannose/fructose/N-acetylgalactosamine-transporter subunit IIB n=1 Tax=Tetragenococcus halophilus TaxID=51669 RepID=UPI001B6B0212|nr:PTS sugar transporter subunit IIB [Tetragenococcus halophilus]MDN6140662.1 PTS sugar transporter subunit IIB [Tetragenococcus koreensis]MDN6749799.1 PTS sugar transporter subunit IIB [Staphylococcus equorum]MCO8287032.1 PTS sugar transporter subunit IIB [Tetragenococcus halophilus]MDN6147011.1 PTS sugar transporter subunit IIB [Tetragenococcus koreensis]MDN6166851.1 PTS sugar transporter subunit IIB [Tetragenococcus koreensis]